MTQRTTTARKFAKVDKVSVPLVMVSLSFLVCSPLSQAADPVLWPTSGAFPAFPANEQERGLQVHTTATYGVDDNLFRVGDQAPDPVADIDGRGDRFLKLNLNAGGRFDVSRQEFQLDLNVDHYSFDRFSILDQWLYAGDADWHWVVGDRAKGDIGYARSRSYPDFSELQFASDDLVTHQYAHVKANWEFLPHTTLLALVEGTQFDHEDVTRAELNNRVTSGTLGLVFAGSLGESIGVQEKETNGDYPNRQVVGAELVDNRYRESESSVVLAKEFDQRFGGDLRVGYTRRRHDEVPQRDFSGVTGRAHLVYAIAPKILLDVAAFRELQAIEDLSASYAIVNGARIGPSWALSSKWVLQAAYAYERRSFDGNPGFVVADTSPREDEVHAAKVAVGYKPNKHLSVALTFEHGKRTSNVDNADYAYNLGLLYVTLSL